MTKWTMYAKDKKTQKWMANILRNGAKQAKSHRVARNMILPGQDIRGGN